MDAQQSALEAGRLTFREEARELLTELEEALLELDKSPDDQGRVGRVFRAMHTLKGSGGMFGFEAVVRLVHEAETVFDRVRAGDMPASPELIGDTLRLRDHLQKLIESAEPAGPVGQDLHPAGEELLGLFRARLEQGPAVPVTTEQACGQCEAPSLRLFWVRYHPDRSALTQGARPLGLLDELADLGALHEVFHAEDIPSLTDYEPSACYSWWDVLLVTSRDEDAVRDVFIFCEPHEAEVRYVGCDAHPRAIERLNAILRESKNLSAAATHQRLQASIRKPAADADASAVERPAGRVKAPFVTKGGGSMRVDSGKLDRLVNLVGELVILQSRLSQTVQTVEHPALRDIAEGLERLSDSLREDVLSIRMLPIGSVFGGLRRLVHDLSVSLGKRIQLVTRGEETEIDKSVIERLKEPLMHILRNCIDHGVEPPEVRLAAGKPEEGTITLEAGQAGGEIILTVSDDGAGLNTERIKRRALERGLLSPEREPTDKEIHALIFEPGFSTAEQVTDVSGRGVGMDVVKRTLDAMRGQLELASEPGRGAILTIRLPLTLAIIDGFQVRVEDEYFVIPLVHVESCSERLVAGQAKEREVMEHRGELIPCLSLRRLFGLPSQGPEIERVIIVTLDDLRVGLAVDKVIGRQQTVIKSLGSMYKHLPWISGAAINGDGRVAVILDVAQLVRGVIDN